VEDKLCLPNTKVSDPATLADYRPISILSILSKIFEKVVLNQMIEHIECNSIYHPQQSGFRKGHFDCFCWFLKGIRHCGITLRR